jgi:hypothetical protein
MRAKGQAMLAGLIVATALAATTAGESGVYGPVRADPPKPAASVPLAESCATAAATGNTRDIVICAQRPEGYRINSDVMEAKREIHSSGPPRYPHETFRTRDCGTVGPMPCFDAGINIVGAAMTAVAMIERLAKGQEIGSMFVTDPHPDEYQLYRLAKQRREAKEAAEALAAALKAKANAKPSDAAPNPAL